MSLVEEEAAALERDIAELEQKIIEQKEYNRKLKIWKYAHSAKKSPREFCQLVWIFAPLHRYRRPLACFKNL